MTAAAWLIAGLGSVFFMAAIAAAKDPEQPSRDWQAIRAEAEEVARARRYEAIVEKAKLQMEAYFDCRVDTWAGRGWWL